MDTLEGKTAILIDYQDHPQDRTMQMFNPPYPAETLREDVLPALNLTVTEAALQLGISRVALGRVLNGNAGISIEMARRLELWLRKPDGSGPTAETWLRMQLSYDLWQARQEPTPDVAPAEGRGKLAEA